MKLFVFSQLGYLAFYKGDMHFRPGICLNKNFIDINSFEIGGNLIATHGLLAKGDIKYYGIEVSYNKINLIHQNFNGVEIRGMYQNVYFPFGFNVQNSVLLAKNSQFMHPEIGIGFAGILSINYGYYFRLDERQGYDASLHSLSLKLSLNLSYGECLNMVGTYPKNW